MCAALQQQTSLPSKFLSSKNGQEQIRQGHNRALSPSANSDSQKEALHDGGRTSEEADPSAESPTSRVTSNDRAESTQDQSTSSPGDCLPQVIEREPLSLSGLEFAILCSAYISPVAEAAVLREAVNSIDLPSLHLIAQDHPSREPQIHCKESLALQKWFREDGCTVLRIQRGHGLPNDRQSLTACRKFIQKFAMCKQS